MSIFFQQIQYGHHMQFAFLLKPITLKPFDQSTPNFACTFRKPRTAHPNSKFCAFNKLQDGHQQLSWITCMAHNFHQIHFVIDRHTDTLDRKKESG
jgi:hypothetical protein